MEVVRQILSVLLVFGLLGLVVWKLRSGSPRIGLRPRRRLWGSAGAECRALESLERLALTPHHELHLVRIHGREIVVATHPQGCAVLISAPESVSGARA
jgi:hypothetical protein